MHENGVRPRNGSNVLLGFESNRSHFNTASFSPTHYTTKSKPWYKSRILSILCVVWWIFTFCLAIMMVVTLVQPHWIGRNVSGAKASFGLYRACSWSRTGDCEGSMLEFDNIPSDVWGVASILVLLSIIICFVAILLWTVFCLCYADSAYVGFRVSSFLVFLAGLLFLVSCVIYPRGFDADEVKKICSSDADSYELGQCSMMWVYWLAIVCTFDSFILSCFGWILIKKDDKILQPKRKPERNTTQLMELNNHHSIGRNSTTI